MARAVVGFRVEITRLEGKWKLNQNHPQERREKVIRVLEESADQDAKEIARLMAKMLATRLEGRNLPIGSTRQPLPASVSSFKLDAIQG